MEASEASIAVRVAQKMSDFVHKNFFEVVTNSNQMSNVQALIGFTFYRVATLSKSRSHTRLPPRRRRFGRRGGLHESSNDAPTKRDRAPTPAGGPSGAPRRRPCTTCDATSA